MERVQQPARTAPDPLDALSRQSGVSAEALALLRPAEVAGMEHLEQMVVRYEQAGSLEPETLARLIEARDQIRAGVEARIQTPGKDVTHVETQHGRAPEDARVRIRGNNINIESNVYIYGSDASQNLANEFERQIQQEWSQNSATGLPWTYADPVSNKIYNVTFNVNIKLYSTRNTNEVPRYLDGPYTSWNRDNFIEITADDSTSEVRGGDEGTWRSQGRDGQTLALDNPAAHEFGHLLGLPDRYFKSGPYIDQPHPEWAGNIMAMDAGHGRVQQRDIDAVLSAGVAQHRRAGNLAMFNTFINP